jgi:hypothetical protein
MKKVLVLGLLMTAVSYTWADKNAEFQQAYQIACEKMKSCALLKIQQQDLPPEAKTMVTQMMDKTCLQMKDRFSAGLVKNSLFEASVACMRSIGSLSCSQIDNAGDDITPECANLKNY